MNPAPEDIRAIARRAVGRIRGEAGRSPAGVAVTVESAGRPGELRPEAGARRPRVPLVTADCLVNVPDGGELRVAVAARITPLAREEAWRRRIRLTEGSGALGALRVAVGSDHGGFELKGEVIASLRELGHRAVDLGPRDAGPCDYPDYALAVGEAVAEGRADVGICVDGAGIGSAMAANKVPGVLAANCWDTQSAENAREHNHANVLTLGAGRLDRAAVDAIVRAFLATAAGPGRHARRAEKIHGIGRRYSRVRAPEAE